MILGKNLIVALDGVAVAGAKSCKLNLSQNFKEVCSPTEARVMEKIPTTYDWGISVDCLIPSSNLSVSLMDKLIKGTKCFITFTDGSGQNRAGFVYVKNCDEGGNIGSLATFSASFESSGALYKYTQYIPVSFTYSGYYGFIIGDSGMVFTDRSTSYGVQITLASSAKALIFANNVNWAVVSMSISDVSECYGHDQYEYVGEAFVVGGTTDKQTTLPSGTYTFLKSGSLASATIYILEEV